MAFQQIRIARTFNHQHRTVTKNKHVRNLVDVSFKSMRRHFNFFRRFCVLRRLPRSLNPGMRVEVEIVKFHYRYISVHHRLPQSSSCGPSCAKMLMSRLHNDVRNLHPASTFHFLGILAQCVHFPLHNYLLGPALQLSGSGHEQMSYVIPVTEFFIHLQ